MTTEQKIDFIITRLEEMDKARGGSDLQETVENLSTKVDKASRAINDLDDTIKLVKQSSDRTNKFLFGENGHFKEAFVYQFNQVAETLAKHLIDCEEKEIAEKKDAEKKDDRKWSIYSPLIVSAIKVVLFGGSTGGAFALVFKFLNP